MMAPEGYTLGKTIVTMDEFQSKRTENALVYRGPSRKSDHSSELASAAAYSPWHADRLFKEATGCAPSRISGAEGGCSRMLGEVTGALSM